MPAAYSASSASPNFKRLGAAPLRSDHDHAFIGGNVVPAPGTTTYFSDEPRPRFYWRECGSRPGWGLRPREP
jgi:hypothetical protein